MKNNGAFLYILSKAVIKRMFIDGLITIEEYERIDNKNKTSFLEQWLAN